MMGLLARIAGPKVLLGVSAASVVAIAALAWLFLSAKEAAATAEAENAQLRATVAQQEEEKFKLRQSREIDRELRKRLEKRHKRTREQERSMRSKLAELQENENASDYFSECPMPDSVYEWVLQQ